MSVFWYVFVVRVPFLFNVIVRSRKFTVFVGFSVFHFNVSGPKAFIVFSNSGKVAVFGSKSKSISIPRTGPQSKIKIKIQQDHPLEILN